MPATYDFTELMDKRKAQVVQTGRSYTRVYQLITSERVSEADATLYVLATQTLVTEGLTIGSEHPDDSGTVVKSVELDDVAADGCQWEVTVEWAYAIGGSLSGDPLSRPAEITWSQPKETVDVFLDQDSKPIINSAGQKFDELPQRDRGALQCRYVVNVTEAFWRTTIFPLINQFDFVVNNDVFEIDEIEIAALRARLEVESVEKITEGATTYRRVSYLLTFREGTPGVDPDGWREAYLDYGHYEFGDDSTELVPIRDADGQIVESPWPLDGNGHKLASADAVPDPVDTFKLYPEVAFAAIGFV